MNAPTARDTRTGVQLLQRLGDRQAGPLGVHLQVADRCNHACAHCYQIQGQKGELTLDQVRAVLDDLATAGVLTLNVSGGEATLRPDLLDILRHARARGFAVRLYTNAFLVDDAMADGIAAAGLLEVHVSVYSAVASEHEAVTRVPGSLARTLGGVRALRARGVRVVLKCPAISLAPDGARGVETLARELGCAFTVSTELTAMEDGSLTSRAVLPTPEELLRQGLITAWTPSPVEDSRRPVRLAGNSCGVGRSGLTVLPDGVVLPCTDTPVPLGNLTRTSLGEMVRTSPELGLFRELTWSHVHGCRDCDLLMACQRCHATALHEGGDYLGPYPGACTRARARYAAGAGTLEVLPPAEGCEPGRSVEIGPYRVEAPGVLRPVPDVRTEADEALAARFPWIRSPARAPADTLVPLRRRREAEGTS